MSLRFETKVQTLPWASGFLIDYQPVMADSDVELLPVAGIRLAGLSAGIKSSGASDLGLIELGSGTTTAAVFTSNAFAAAPVTLARQHLRARSPCYLLVNSGNANAGTGEEGLMAARESCAGLARLTGRETEQVLPFSTGVIGEPLPWELLVKALPACLDRLNGQGWRDFAAAIMTTDTRLKGCSEIVDLDDGRVTITGVAKGSGMIKPDMATMLAYIATDAKIAVEPLRALLLQVTRLSFNRIVVDGDVSTNDACVLMASGASGIAISPAHSAWGRFTDALQRVASALAKAIVRDGEGATKFVTLKVTGGGSEQECLLVADAIARSPLVKTAFFASDPNWGRILAAVGYAGVANLDVLGVTIHLDDCCIVRQGARAKDYREEDGQAVFSKPEFVVWVELGRGECKAEVYTCDFSYDYVRINAAYRS